MTKRVGLSVVSVVYYLSFNLKFKNDNLAIVIRLNPGFDY